jgi:PEP-CTERM motif
MQKSVVSSLAIGALGAMAAVLPTHPAQAFSVNISPTVGSTENTGASASLDFSFAQSGADTWLNLGITNTTNGTLGLGATQATLVGVAFDFPLNLAYTYDPLSSNFTTVYDPASLPPYGSFDVGIRSAGPGNFAGGNPSQGLNAGQSTTVRLTFAGQAASSLESSFQSLFATSSAQNPLIVGRFQQVNAGGGSDKVVGTSEAVPEPTTMLGLAVAGAVGVAMKRQQLRKQKRA